MPAIISILALMIVVFVLSAKRKPLTQKSDAEVRQTRDFAMVIGVVALISSFTLHLHLDWFADWLEWGFRGVIVLSVLVIHYRCRQELKNRKAKS
jgi:multisubunit Na+/H+ antiporter MnhB subunit